MTKADIVAEIAIRTGIEKSVALHIVDTFFRVVKNSLICGENIYFRKFGNFVIKKRANKMGRNIRNNTFVPIDEHYIPNFKPSVDFKERVKQSVKLNARLYKE